MRVRLRDLSAWWKSTFVDRREPISIAGSLRDKGAPQALELLDFGGSTAETVRLALPEKTPIATLGGKRRTCEFDTPDDEKWWSGWAAVLAAGGLVPPVVDAQRLADLLHDPRRIRFCCDTNALAGGVVSWLLLVLGGRVDLVTSAVVDRELAAWPDQGSTNFWGALTVKDWYRRTQYRLARRLIEAPPPGVVIDRLSPEQGALMLAKHRDEEGRAKSPDADVLLIELARGLVRDQPRNARVVFLTGDRTNARTATGVLGAEGVLYAAADGASARQRRERVIARGVWRPEGPLGAIDIEPAASLIWDLLAACNRLRLTQRARRWEITACVSVLRGVPSDWAEPWVEIVEPTSDPAPVAPVSTETEIAPMTAPAEELGVRRGIPSPPRGAFTASNDWLLAPVQVGELLNVPIGLRPQPRMIFSLLARALGGPELPPRLSRAETMAEALRVVVALGATDAAGGPGPRANEFRGAWLRADHDWFHAELQRLPGYAAALLHLRADASWKRSARQEVQISMARALGQVARLDREDGGLIVGDAPLRASALLAALDRWFPEPGTTLATEDLCRLAAAELCLTPARFERAMERLWASGSGLHFDGGTGGTVVPGFAEHVIALGQLDVIFQPVAPGDLSFGRSGPVRFVTRTG